MYFITKLQNGFLIQNYLCILFMFCVVFQALKIHIYILLLASSALNLQKTSIRELSNYNINFSKPTQLDFITFLYYAFQSNIKKGKSHQRFCPAFLHIFPQKTICAYYRTNLKIAC